MSNQRRIVRDAVLKQPGYNAKRDYAQQMAAHYEGRITAASNAEGMQAIQEDILSHKKENKRYLRRANWFANTAAIVVALVSAAAGAVGASAALASMISGSALMNFLVVGSITYAVGYIVFESSKMLFQGQQEARDKTEAENNALTGLENKLKQKLPAGGKLAAGTSDPAKKTSLLGKLRALFKKSAAKPADSPAIPKAAATTTQKTFP